MQSGCDETLRRMNRKYTAERFYESVDIMRRHFPNCAAAADLIVGFPGETEREFEETLRFIERCEMSFLHVFPYSRRPGTPAADMPGQLTSAEKHERASRAIELASRLEGEYLSAQVGRTLEVLFETESEGISSGHSENYCRVETEGVGLKNVLAKIAIKEVKNGALLGISVL